MEGGRSRQSKATPAGTPALGNPKSSACRAADWARGSNAGVTRGHVPVLSPGSQQDTVRPPRRMKKHTWDPQPGREMGVLPVGRALARGGAGVGATPVEWAISSKARPGGKKHIGVCREGSRQTVSPMATRPTRLPKYNSKKAARWKPPAGSVEKGREGKWTAPASAPPLAPRWGRKSWAKGPSCVLGPGTGPALLETVCSHRVLALTAFFGVWLVGSCLPYHPIC